MNAGKLEPTKWAYRTWTYGNIRVHEAIIPNKNGNLDCQPYAILMQWKVSVYDEDENEEATHRCRYLVNRHNREVGL